MVMSTFCNHWFRGKMVTILTQDFLPIKVWTFRSWYSLATSKRARAPWTAISRVGVIKMTWTVLRSILTIFKALRTKTRVLPVPDLAWTTKSTPKLAKGSAAHWTGEGLTYPALLKPFNILQKRLIFNKDNKKVSKKLTFDLDSNRQKFFWLWIL